MCRFRRVCNTYLCGHQEQLPDELIYCYRTNCRFSPNHDPNCVFPQCRNTCTQTRGYPEQYSPHVQSVCRSCK